MADLERQQWSWEAPDFRRTVSPAPRGEQEAQEASKGTSKAKSFQHLGHGRAVQRTEIEPAKQPRKHSAKYLLRKGEYIDNWNNLGCELSELYGRKSPQMMAPSPVLSNTSRPISPCQGSGQWMSRISTGSPTCSCDMPCSSTASSSRILHSPFLISTPESEKLMHSPILADFTDLAQAIMTDFRPIAYSSNALSAVADSLWDVPVVIPAKPSRAFQLPKSRRTLSQNAENTFDMISTSPSATFLWSLQCSADFPPACPPRNVNGGGIRISSSQAFGQ